MKSLYVLLKCILQDCSIHCDTTTTRDLKTIMRRVKAEGVSFLTITLSDYATDFEKSLEHSHIDSCDFRSFSKVGSIPRLFSGMISQVFDKDGNLLKEPSIVAINCIRQVCRMWKKILLPCTDARVEAALLKYLECEKELDMFEESSNLYCYLSRPTSNLRSLKATRFDDETEQQSIIMGFSKVSTYVWEDLRGRLSAMIIDHKIIPNHGTGAVALKVLQNQKYVWREWHQRLETYFPSDLFCYNNYSSYLEEASKLELLNLVQERPVRVVTVPKTLKTPRIIAVEPACMQYTQQGLLQPLVDYLETHDLTKGHVNFRDQKVNAQLALDNSLSGHLATLDLSEASDRVHNALVECMFGYATPIGEAIQACRSSRAVLPNRTTIDLVKFASMGSALCFPVESMVFFTILILSELRRLKLQLTRSNVYLVSRYIYVYGDDLIIPVDGVKSAIIHLEALGLKVNARKSFSLGNFRESCGMDAYFGHDITTIYARRLLPRSRRDVEGIISAVSLSNQLYKKGYFATVNYIEEHLKSIKVDVPYVTETTSCVGYTGRNKPLTIHRRCDKLQVPQVRGYVVVAKEQCDRIDGHAALMKWFLKGLNPDRKHFQHSVGNGRLAIKVRWCNVY